MLPDEIIKEILSYNADYHPNLMKCFKEMLGNEPAPCGKTLTLESLPDFENWRNRGYGKNNIEDHTFRGNPMSPGYMKLKLHGIEIAGARLNNDNTKYIRIVKLYYGWAKYPKLISTFYENIRDLV